MHPLGARATRYLRCLFPLHINKNQVSLHERKGDYEPDDCCNLTWKLTLNTGIRGYHSLIGKALFLRSCHLLPPIDFHEPSSRCETSNTAAAALQSYGRT